MSRLEAEVKEPRANTLGKQEEIKTLNGELLVWVNRWQELKLKKCKYKVFKRSVVVSNELLIKQGEKQNVKIIKIQAKLFEARPTAKLKITT